MSMNIDKEKLIDIITDELRGVRFDNKKKRKKIKITVGKKKSRIAEAIVQEETAIVPEVKSIGDAQYELAKAYIIIQELNKEVQRLGAIAEQPGMSWKQCLDHVNQVNLVGKGDLYKPAKKR